MKKQSQLRKTQSKQVRTLEQTALADASAGTAGQAIALVEPYLPQQHNETIVRDRHEIARRAGGRSRRGSQVMR